MPKNVNWWTRRIHRWCALVSALPMLLVIVSGLLLQVKKQAAVVQPPTKRGAASNVTPDLTWDEMLNLVRSQASKIGATLIDSMSDRRVAS